MLGGDAFSGHAEGGHYFLGSAGKLVEVSRNVWMYSYVHVILNIVTFGMALVALAVIVVRGLTGSGQGRVEPSRSFAEPSLGEGSSLPSFS